MKSLDAKLRKIANGAYSRKDFIIADAKDADMAGGIYSGGKKSDGKPISVSEYRDKIEAVVRQGIVDIMLMSASNLEELSVRKKIFAGSKITPAARANDTSDIWRFRGAKYAESPSRPFSTAKINSIMHGKANAYTSAQISGADLGLYSTTFNNNLDCDYESLTAFSQFREECECKHFRYFWEVFNPNASCGLSKEDIPAFVNDCIVRTLAGATKLQRPIFLKINYNGPRAMEELAAYDESMPVGILGGSSGTTFDAFNLLYQAQKYGAKVALFGRKINNSEDQLSFITFLRRIADGEIEPAEAVRAYHGELQKKGIAPIRELTEDLRETINLS